MPDDIEEKIKEDVQKGVSLAWLFPGCSCLLIILFLIIGIGAFVATFARHQGEESATGGFGGGSLTCPPGLTQQAGMCLDNYMKSQVPSSPLIGHGSTFVSAGQQSNVNPALMVAIAQMESSLGTAGSGPPHHNPFGWGCNPCKHFSNWDEGIYHVTQKLRDNYINEGYDTIEKIGNRWAPVGASNDPYHTNNQWVPGVTRFFNAITSACPEFTQSSLGVLVTQCTAYPINPGVITRYNSTLHGNSVYHPSPNPGHGTFERKNGIGDAVDLFAPVGTPVYAPFSGTCTIHNNGDTRENARIISSDGSMITRLAHIYVQKCSGPVNAGDTVGTLRPLRSGPHLHFELWVNGNPISSPQPGQSLWNKMKSILSQHQCSK